MHRKKKKKKRTKNVSLSTSEIKRRMPGIPVHRVSDYSQHGFSYVSGDTPFELYYISKSDAADHLNALQHLLHAGGHDIPDNPAFHTPCRIIDAPLSHLINEDGTKEKVAEFHGVPVFQSDCLTFTDRTTGDTFSPAFLRKEDLDNLIAKAIKPENRDIIKVSAFEDIIQKMKDHSTSESNDVFFVGPGITSWTWFLL